MQVLHNMGEYRILEVHEDDVMRKRYFHKDGEPVKFKRKQDTKRLAAVVYGALQIFKLPNAHQFHKEYMAHNARAMWCGLQSDPERLVDNMLEHDETI